jgi:hypothetical protein
MAMVEMVAELLHQKQHQYVQYHLLPLQLALVDHGVQIFLVIKN